MEITHEVFMAILAIISLGVLFGIIIYFHFQGGSTTLLDVILGFFRGL